MGYWIRPRYYRNFPIGRPAKGYGLTENSKMCPLVGKFAFVDTLKPACYVPAE
jgi:hypothetical protein